MKIEAMKEFKKSNIANAILLNVITLGFYSIYWLGEQRRHINSKTTSNQLPISFVIACYILLALFWTFSHGIIYLYFPVKILLLFEIRSKIQHITKIDKSNDHWINPVYLFIFGFLYLIYKIDKFPTNQKI